MLKLFVNPCLYEPAHFLGWSLPVVSPNQVGGTWTEPVYFAIWLAFAVPFLVHRLFEKNDITAGGWLWRGGCLTALFTVWWMTHARTSVVLMVPLVVLYLTAALLMRAPQSQRPAERPAGFLSAAMAAAFLLVSQWGPQDIGRTESTFVETTVKSSVEAESRSNPSRLQDFMSKVGVFREHPLWGVGDTLASWYQMEWLQTSSETLTEETQDRIRKAQASVFFDSGLNGNSLFVPAILAGRGLVGFTTFMLPILATGLGLLEMLRRRKRVSRAVGITVFIASVGPFLSAFSQGLWFFYFWCALGLAWGFIVCGRREC